jgi:starch synthase
MQIVFATSEVAPIAQTGGLGDVCGSLPRALHKAGHDIVVVMPFYRQAMEYFSTRGGIEQIVAPQLLSWANWTHEFSIYEARLPDSEVRLLLIANPFFFDRDSIYSPDPAGRDDGVERFAFFCRAVIRACELLGLQPDILHSHDWHTALLPLYLHSGLRYQANFRNTASVYTIHNLNYQGIGRASQFAALGLTEHYWDWRGLEHWGQLNLMKGGILLADEVTTVSPTYAREIQTPLLGAGLDGILRSRATSLTGILNGIDEDEWNPATDRHLTTHFSAEHIGGKLAARRALSREAGFKFTTKIPLIGIVSRLVEQKGFDLLLPVLRHLLDTGTRMVILGSGDPALETGFEEVARKRPNECRIWTGFQIPLAHKIIAGADMMLMPSRYEPCGLNQMYALRYGTLPIVRLTGGLADTVEPYDGTNRATANGFGFIDTTPRDLYLAVWTALLNFRDGSVWKSLQQNGMPVDFSWHASARRYEGIYRRAQAIRA